MEEVWATIKGIETHEVSTLGRVRSKDRISIVTANGLGGHAGIVKYQRQLRGRLLSPNNTRKNGEKSYSYISVNDETYLIHRLVAATFLDHPQGKDFVNHIDGDKWNNRADNLEWCTVSENEKHSYSALGKIPWNKGIHYDVTNAQAVRRRNHLKRCAELLAEWRSGESRKRLAIKHNRCYRQICDNINKAIKAESEVRDE